MKKIVIILFLFFITVSLKSDDSLNFGTEKYISFSAGIGNRIFKGNQNNIKSFFDVMINTDIKLYKIMYLKIDFDFYDDYNENVVMLSLGPSIKFNVLNISKKINLPIELSLLGMVLGEKEGLGFSISPVISPALYFNVKNFAFGLKIRNYFLSDFHTHSFTINYIANPLFIIKYNF